MAPERMKRIYKVAHIYENEIFYCALDITTQKKFQEHQEACARHGYIVGLRR